VFDLWGNLVRLSELTVPEKCCESRRRRDEGVAKELLTEWWSTLLGRCLRILGRDDAIKAVAAEVQPIVQDNRLTT
jgi:hypothetical protein